MIQMPTSNLVLVHNPEIPTHTSVLADRSSLSTVRYPLLDAWIWDASRNPLLVKLSSPLFSCTSLLAACWSVIAALLVTRHKAYGTSSFSLINVPCSWYPVAYSVLYIYLAWNWDSPATGYEKHPICKHRAAGIVQWTAKSDQLELRCE